MSFIMTPVNSIRSPERASRTPRIATDGHGSVHASLTSTYIVHGRCQHSLGRQCWATWAEHTLRAPPNARPPNGHRNSATTTAANLKRQSRQVFRNKHPEAISLLKFGPLLRFMACNRTLDRRRLRTAWGRSGDKLQFVCFITTPNRMAFLYNI